MTTEIKPRTVYKLVRTDKLEDGTDIYVGSTSQPLSKRLQIHRAAVGIQSSILYKKMQEVGKYNWKIVPLLVHICDQKEIREFEKHWAELLNPDLNVNLPFKENNEKDIERVKEHQRNSLENKRYYCRVCEKAFGCKAKLQAHLKTLKHSNNYMNSID